MNFSDEIKLTSYQENELIYTYEAAGDRLALFSEVYYPKGWKVFIDGEEVNHFRANYVLRALEVPAGKHEVRFSFQPDVVQYGSTISLVSFVVLILIGLGGLVYRFKFKQIQQ